MCVLKLLLNKVNNSLKKNVSPSRTTIYLCCSNLSKTALHPPFPFVCGGKGRHKKNIPDGLECFGNGLVINWEKLLHFHLRQIGFS